MKPRRKIGILLSAAVLMQLLSGCNALDPTTSPEPDDSSRPVQSRRVVGPDDPAEPSESAPEPDLWDPEHRLEFSFTPSRGLELPVEGATGYASVELPLWEALPEEDEGKLATIYAPPEPKPEETSDPAEESDPDASDEPSDARPDDSPAGEDTGEPPQSDEPPEEPAWFISADEPLVTPIAESTEEPVPEETLDPGAESTLEPTPEFTPEPIWDPSAGPSPEETSDPAEEPTDEPDPSSDPDGDEEPDPDEEPEDPMEEALLVLEPGTAFLILGESGDWWQVTVQDVTGWIEHRYCLINLPDVIPSMIYNNTNSYSSVYVSSGKEIPNITGKALYQAKAQNDRLGRQEFMMPVLYAMAKDVCQAQQNALAEGNTLVLYEGYRPYSTQMAVVRGLSALVRTDAEVKAGVTTSPWNISWFIATGTSNHQRGYAMDVSLAKVTKAHIGAIGGYSVVQVDEYEEYVMPTPIHELSMAAATYTRPVAIFSATAWKSAPMTEAMASNQPARALQRYCTDARLTPLASEWWHFNDLSAYSQSQDYPSSGNYQITQCLSMLP